jgi:hypothetical protein
MAEHDLAIVGEVFVQAHAGWAATQHARARRLAHFKRLVPQVQDMLSR